MQTIKDLISSMDYIDAADGLEELLPDIYKAIGVSGAIDVTEGKYRLHSTRSGFLNISNQDSNYHFYSNIDPVWEKYELARSLYVPSMKHFFVIGCGMGYLPWQMYEVSNEAIQMHIYDMEQTVIEYAKNFGVLDYIPNESVDIYVGKSVEDILSRFISEIEKMDETEYVLYIEDFFFKQLSTLEKNILNVLLANIYTDISFKDISEQNYYRNHVSVDKSIYDIDFNRFHKKWIVLGGGPSIDENIQYIKECKGEKTLIAASTICKRLLVEGIEPDIIVAIDPQNRTYGHMEGIEDIDSLLIISESANWKFGEHFNGEKYLVCDSNKFYAKQNAYFPNKWNTQSTVTAFGVEIAAFAKATSIEMVGVDLAFPNLMTHAEGTMDRSELKNDNLIKIPSVDGGMVYTSSQFKIYIADIEEQIENHKDIVFYNLSKHGALIKGCK